MHPYASQAKASHSRRLNVVAGKSGNANSMHHDTAKVAGIANASKTAGEMAMKGGKPRPRADRFARGGAVKSKKGTQVNIIIAGKPDQDAAAKANAVPVPVPMPAGPPPAPPMMPPPGAGGPPGMPPGAASMMHKSGGRVASFKRGGAVKKHDDEAQDKKLIGTMLKAEEKKEMKKGKFADGGVVKADKTVGMTAGAADGEGRLEKVAKSKKNPKGEWGHNL